MSKFASYINPTYFYETECKSIAANCSAIISVDCDSFTVQHQSFDGIKHFETVDTLYAFLIGLSIGINTNKLKEQLLCG